MAKQEDLPFENKLIKSRLSQAEFDKINLKDTICKIEELPIL